MKRALVLLALAFMLAANAALAADSAEITALKKKAEAGDAVAQRTLGFIYVNGFGVPKDSAEALKWYRLAAWQGNADAQFNLGLMYAKGEGIEKDLVQAHFWINEAAHENADAKKSLALVEAQMTGAQISEAIEKEKRFNQAHALLAKLPKEN